MCWPPPGRKAPSLILRGMGYPFVGHGEGRSPSRQGAASGAGRGGGSGAEEEDLGRHARRSKNGASWPTARPRRSRSAGEEGWPSGEVAVGSVETRGQGPRLKNPNSGRRLMFDHQRVPVTPARRGQKDRLARQCERIDQVDQVLEKPGIAALVDRAAHHQCVAERITSSAARAGASRSASRRAAPSEGPISARS